MIISDRHRFAFIHIPKCAGTFARKRLEQYDDTNGFFTGRHEHKALGLIDFWHIPLPTLKEFFPSDFERIARYQTFAVLRDPYERFPSSVSQRLLSYKQSAMRTIGARDLRKEVDEVIAHLSGPKPAMPIEYTHFFRQADFVECAGRRIVQRLYPLSSVSNMLRDVGRIVDADLLGGGGDAEPRNQSMVFRSAAWRAAVEHVRPFVGTFAAKWPQPMKSAIRSLIYVPRREKVPEIFSSTYVREFVCNFYSRDIELYDELLGESAR
jgi:hypothetical protein